MILPGEKFSAKGDDFFHDACFEGIISRFSKEDYTKRYDLDYFTGHPELETQPFWEKGMFRYGDQCAAIAYALGYQNFEEVKEVLRFEGIGKWFSPQISGSDQIFRLCDFHTREPRGILEIGGGRGEVSLGFQLLEVNVQLVEPSPDLYKLIDLTREKFNFTQEDIPIKEIPLLRVINLPLSKAISEIDWDIIDTIIFIESIEHIMKEEFERFYEVLKAKFKGLMIIVNWIDYHPITLNPPWHIRRIDDTFYNRLCKDGHRIFRRGSHLVLKY